MDTWAANFLVVSFGHILCNFEQKISKQAQFRVKINHENFNLLFSINYKNLTKKLEFWAKNGEKFIIKKKRFADTQNTSKIFWDQPVGQKLGLLHKQTSIIRVVNCMFMK